MVIRLINSLLTLPLVCLFWIHVIPLSLFLLGYLSFSPDRKLWAYLFAFLIILHGILSLALAVQKQILPRKRYLRENKNFLLQSAAGILILALIALHAVSFGYTTPQGAYTLRDLCITTYLMQILLPLAIGIHCMISIPNLCITLGLITQEHHQRIARIAAAAITLPPVILSLIAFTGYYLPALTGGVW